MIPLLTLYKTNPEPLIEKQTLRLSELLNFLKYTLSEKRISYTLILILLGPFIWSTISPYASLAAVYEADFPLLFIAGFISVHSAISAFLGHIVAKISDDIGKRSLLLCIAELIGSLYAASLLYSISTKSPFLYIVASILAGLSAAASAGVGVALVTELKPWE